MRAEQAFPTPETVRNCSETFRSLMLVPLPTQYFCGTVGAYGFVSGCAVDSQQWLIARHVAAGATVGLQALRYLNDSIGSSAASYVLMNAALIARIHACWPRLYKEIDSMKSSIVAYQPLPADVLAWLRERAQVVKVNAAPHDARVAADAALARNVAHREGLAR
ncbi:hypothetical protein GCM10027093_64870 [Paraburkholderia jirisanensis]